MNDQQRTILIVDDREENRYSLRHTLTRAGFLTVEAATGAEALAMSRSLPDVVVLDVRLPDILGYEVCRRLKANAQTRHIPVLQLSAAFLSTESKLYALESGADSYLVQPVDPMVLVATVRSLVRLHQAEKQAQVAAQQWAMTFDALSEGVAIVHDGVVQRCNRAMTKLLGVSYSQIERKSFPELLRHRFEVEEAELQSGADVHVQMESRFFKLCMSRLPPDWGTPGSIFIVSDTTPQKRAEEALLLNERLAATGRMAHIIAHEINNPLEAITNLLYLAQTSEGVQGEAHGFLQTAANEVDRVSQISRQILSFHREARDPVEICLAELVEGVLALATHTASKRRLAMRLEVDRDLVILGMPARLRQAFSNIIRNAIEASGEGGPIHIRIARSSMRRGESFGRAVRVTIADAGTGIPRALQGRIFEAFFTTKDQKGSGVGLWLTATIVQEHGGRLQVRSSTEPGRSGTCISLLLPMAERTV